MVWADWVPYIAIQVPGAPNAVIEQAVRRAAEQFCVMSRVYQVYCDMTRTIAGVADYAISPPLETEFVAPIRVMVDDHEVYPTREDLLPLGWRSAQRGTPSQYVMAPGGILSLYNVPDKAKLEVSVFAAVKPSAEAEQLDDSIAFRWREAIALGALSSLLILPNKSWTDMPGAALCIRGFHSSIADARIDSEKGLSPHQPRVRMRPFA